MNDDSISLNKFISDTGYCSRREADQLIREGRVLLNGVVARTGNRYFPGDQVEVDGSEIAEAKKEKLVYLAFNKPVGITSTTELQVKDNIISFINYPKRIFPIGRLDKDSQGLIFLTNDGNIVNKILRAGNRHEKEYIVSVNKPIDQAFVKSMSEGVPVLGEKTLPCKVKMQGRQTFNIVLTQGLNRQIRRMCEYLGYKVTSLQRVRIMNIRLDQLAVGKWRYLSEAEIADLRAAVKDSSKTADPAALKTSAAKQPAPPKPGLKPEKTREQNKPAKPGQKIKAREDNKQVKTHAKSGQSASEKGKPGDRRKETRSSAKPGQQPAKKTRETTKDSRPPGAKPKAGDKGRPTIDAKKGQDRTSGKSAKSFSKPPSATPKTKPGNKKDKRR